MPTHGIPRGVIARAGNLLRSTTAFMAVSAWCLPQPAEAQCLPANPASGGTVTCSPDQNGNYTVSNLDSLTVHILPGASINGTFVATGIGTLAFLNSGNTNGLATLSTTTSLVFQNSGVINQGLTITSSGTSSITNDVDRSINGTFRSLRATALIASPTPARSTMGSCLRATVPAASTIWPEPPLTAGSRA